MRYFYSLVFSVLFFVGSFSFAQDAPGKSSDSIRLPEPPVPTDAAVPPSQTSEGEKAEAPKSDTSEMVYLNVQDEELQNVIRQISKATGRNFIIDGKVKGKITILSEKMMTKEEAYQTFLSALEVSGFTVVKGPAGIIKIISLKQAARSPIPTHVDSTPYTDSYITRLISLTNISAVEMANAIRELISPDANMFAYPATNSLIITDTGTNIDRLMKIIKELDQEGPQQVVEIIPILYADAEQVATTVLSLFEAEKAGGAARARTANARARTQAAGSEEVEEVSKIISDTRTNSVIVLASKRSIQKVRDLISRLDTQLSENIGTIHVHYLKYANAEELATTLSTVTSGATASASAGKIGGTAAAAKEKAGGAVETSVARFEGGITIGADTTTNSLIITASPKDYTMLVDSLISKLDVPRKQVYLESMVMELFIRKGSTFGLSGYSGGGNGTVLGFGSTFGSLSQMFDPTSMFSSGGLLGGVFGRDSISIDVPVAAGGTRTVTLPAFAAFLNLISSYTNANIISTPNILTIDNEEASIEVKQKEYAASTTTTATGFSQSTPVPLEAGLTLKITPQISEGDAVRLNIEHELSNFEARGDAIASPTRTRKITTTVMAMNGQTVVLGGLMEDTELTSKEKIPILGDIPVLGLLFKRTDKSSRKTNLLVFITPHVIKDPSDFSDVMQRKITQRNRFITDNYGKKQEQLIKDMIRSHREDLLEYTPSSPFAPVDKEINIKDETDSSKADVRDEWVEDIPKKIEPIEPKSYSESTVRQPVKGETREEPKKIEESDLAY